MELYVTCLMLTIAGVASQLSSSPVVVREYQTASFRWQVSTVTGGSVPVAVYVISPSGAQVLLVNTNTNNHQTLGNYTARVTYTGDLTADPKVMTFDLRSVVRSDAGDYICGSNGIADIIPQCGQKLVVPGQPSKPTLNGQSAPVFGRQFTMTCSSTSTTVPADHGLTFTYTWQSDNTNITVTSPGSSYNFTVSSRDSHSYRCKATEGQGLESEWSQLYNMEPQYDPYAVTLQPSTLSYTRKEGQERVPSILCSATCRPACTYKWFKDGTVHSDGATLTLPVADRSQAGSYKCQASNTHGTDDSSSVSVDVTYAATITSFSINTQENTRTVNEHDPVSFRCQVDSNPMSSITLNNGSVEISRADNSLTHEFNLTGTACRQRGNYTCTADNNINGLVRREVEMLVKCSPRYDESYPVQGRYASATGSDVSLSVNILSYPGPTITWSRTNITTQRNLTSSSSLTRVSDLTVTSTLTLTNLKEEDFGEYQVYVNNGVGQAVEYSITLDPKGPPSPPTHVAVTPSGPSSLQVSWTKGFNGGGTQTFIVEYSTDDATWTEAGMFVETDEEVYEAKITDLQPKTVYFVRVFAKSISGKSNYTISVRGLTEEDKGPSAAMIAGAAGGSIAALLLLVLVLVAVLFIRYKRKTTDDDKEKMAVDGKKDEITGNDRLEMKDNVCYTSSDDVMKPGASGSQGAAVSDVYAAVDKKKLKPVSKPNETCAEVQKPGNKTVMKQAAKKDKAKKGNSKDDKTPLKTKNKQGKKGGKTPLQTRNKRGKKGEAYENTGIGEEGNPYINHGFEVQPENIPVPVVESGPDEKGLHYVGIDFSGHNPSPQVHREKESTEYAGIQFGVVGQLPEEEKKKEEQV